MSIKVHQVPLDEIEAKEVERKAKHQAVIDAIIQARESAKSATVPSELIAIALASMKNRDTDGMEEFKPVADAEILASIRSLEESLAATIGREAAAAELVRLRKEAEEHAEADRVAEIARKAVEAERKRAEAVEAERIAKEVKERADAETAQLAIQAKKDREATEATAAAIKRENDAKAAEQAAIAAKVEADRRAALADSLIKAEEARQVAAAAAAEAKAKVDAERAERLAAAEANNRAIVIATVVAGLRALAVDGKVPTAPQIAEAVAAGKVPNLIIDWTV